TFVNMKQMVGTYFNFEKCKIKNSRFFPGKDTAMIRFKRCILNNASVSYAGAGPEINVVVENCKGKPNDYGANLSRRVSRPYAGIKTSYSADPKEEKKVAKKTVKGSPKKKLVVKKDPDAWMMPLLMGLSEVEKARVLKAAGAFDKLKDAPRGDQLEAALEILRKMIKQAVAAGSDVYAYVTYDGERKKVKLLRFDNGNVVVRPAGDMTEKQIEFSTFDAKTLAGCGMSCVGQDDVNGIIAVI
ncbi:unnamed protein product, partial [marine sediment metagenome]